MNRTKKIIFWILLITILLFNTAGPILVMITGNGKFVLFNLAAVAIALGYTIHQYTKGA